MNRIGNGPTPPGGHWDDEDNDWFFDTFDKGAKGFAKLAGIALVVNLIFWLVIIAAVIFGLSLVF